MLLLKNLSRYCNYENSRCLCTPNIIGFARTFRNAIIWLFISGFLDSCGFVTLFHKYKLVRFLWSSGTFTYDNSSPFADVKWNNKIRQFLAYIIVALV